MPLFAETEQKIFGDILFDVVNNTVITRTSPGAKMKSLVDAVSKKMGQMYTRFDLNISQAFLNGAKGKYLDFIGSMLNLPRLGESRAVVAIKDRNMRFYVEIGTFGDINGGSSILLPAGTIVSSDVAASGNIYKLLVSVVLSASASEAFVPAEALRSGTQGNLGKNALRFHNFNNYVDTVSDSLKVTNDAEISAGQNPESDTNYRFRIANQTVASESANATAIRLAALTVPGVANIVILPQARGIGSFDLLIQSITPIPSETLLSAVRESVLNHTAAGNIGSIRAPIELGMTISGNLILRKVVSASEQTNIINAATQNITAYINNLDIGEEFIFNEAIERVMATSELIKDIGVPTLPFEELFSYTPSRVEDNKIRSSLISNFSPQTDAKISIELKYAGSTPILFAIA